MADEPLVHEMLRDAEQAEEPGNMKIGTPIGNANGIQMTATELRSAGYCLLYTSPSPRDGLLSRMPSSA